ncbi:phage tail protein [Alcaligenes faecalis]|uniref:phage tail protein n=1 Tax=Alcaligenes faecalis TaxID=511 RepID=UPI001EF0486F|nr:phage tail protein [Alcaligenes faecalis]ULH08589.1 phage tail protein [Alcaligenes faecalis]
MAWYDTGTVNVTANSATVTGVGTQWLAGARRGEAFVAPDGRLYEVLNIASNTSLTLTKPYRGTTASGQQYALAPMQGYVKELADRAAQLLSEYGLASDAEAVALTSKTKALTPYGLGLNLKDASTTVKGLTAYATDAEATARTSKTKALSPYGLDLNVQSSPNDATAGKLLAVGRSFGLGSVGTSSKWPSASLNDVNVPAGMYYVNSSIADRPTTEPGIVWHRQAGPVAAQIYLSSEGSLLFRGRRNEVYRAWKTTLNVGEYGLGAGTVAPPNGRDNVNPFGWYYQASPVPSWGGGAFFLDMPYDSNQNAGLRLSTDPYTDDFYLNGGVSGKKEYRPACKLVHDKNIVGDVGAGSVVQTGSNVNGTWVRFADGTQICYGYAAYSGTGWDGKAWQYPMAFISQPSATATGTGDNAGFAAAPILEVHNSGLTFRKFVGSTENTEWARFSVIVIGRWKA